MAGAAASADPTPRRDAAIDLAVMAVVAAAALAWLSPGPAAIGGGVRLKLVFLARTGVLIAVATGLLRRRGRGWRDVGLRAAPLGRIAPLVPAGLVAVGIAAVTTKALLARLGYAPPDFSAFRPLRGDGAEYLFWLVPGSVVCAALGEELLFRGFLLDAVRRLLGDRPASLATAIAGQAALFGALHAYQGAGGVATTAMIGLVLGLLWLAARRTLWAGIVVHGVLDTSAMTAIWLGALRP